MSWLFHEDAMEATSYSIIENGMQGIHVFL